MKMKNISYIYFSFYIEMKGREDQPEGVPDTVHLLVRHKIPPSSEMETVISKSTANLLERCNFEGLLSVTL